MARRRVNRDKYSKVKPKVSAITYVIVGLFLFGIIFTMAMFIDTPKQKFYKKYNRAANQANIDLKLEKDHDYKAISLKKLRDLVEKGEDVVVFVGNPGCPVCLKTVGTVQAMYDNESGDSNKVAEYVDVIYYLELDQVQSEEQTSFQLDGLRDFYMDYELKRAGSIPDLIAFRDNKAITQYESETFNGLTDEQNIFRNVNTFFSDATDAFGLE